MGLFDFLKPKWRASGMTEVDCRRVFDSLKQTTSYTAWKRCRDRYAVFVELMERQCKEEPVGRLTGKPFEDYKRDVESWVAAGEFPRAALNTIHDVYKTEWTQTVYSSVLEGLVFYDKGLERLRQGDRTVFLFNGAGVFWDAVNTAEHQRVLYVDGGPKGGDGMVYYGKYVQAMKAALVWSVENLGFSAYGLQNRSATPCSSVYWKPGRTLVRTPEEQAEDALLPPIPYCPHDVQVRSGEPVPVSGIYQAQVVDGSMDYMAAGQPALRYGEGVYYAGDFVGGEPVTWKLVWADDRYADGVVPDDEAPMFPPQTAPDFVALWEDVEYEDERPKEDRRVTARTGQIAPYSGIWAAMDDLHGRVHWPKGKPLPQHRGRDVEWAFVPGIG